VIQELDWIDMEALHNDGDIIAGAVDDWDFSDTDIKMDMVALHNHGDNHGDRIAVVDDWDFSDTDIRMDMVALHNDGDRIAGAVDDWDFSDTDIKMDMETLVRENVEKAAGNVGKVRMRSEASKEYIKDNLKAKRFVVSVQPTKRRKTTC